MPDNKIEKINHLRNLSVLLDSKFQGPLGIKFGLDALIGLIPFVGDFVTVGFSLYIIGQAALLGCSSSTLLRMVLNVLLENVFDLVPIIGNFFDIYWKANNKNLLLIEQHLQNPTKVTTQSTLVLIGFLTLLVGLVALSAYISYKFIILIYNSLASL